jgi:hypothetical protein
VVGDKKQNKNKNRKKKVKINIVERLEKEKMTSWTFEEENVEEDSRRGCR